MHLFPLRNFFIQELLSPSPNPIVKGIVKLSALLFSFHTASLNPIAQVSEDEYFFKSQSLFPDRRPTLINHAHTFRKLCQIYNMHEERDNEEKIFKKYITKTHRAQPSGASFSLLITKLFAVSFWVRGFCCNNIKRPLQPLRWCFARPPRTMFAKQSSASKKQRS